METAVWARNEQQFAFSFFCALSQGSIWGPGVLSSSLRSLVGSGILTISMAVNNLGQGCFARSQPYVKRAAEDSGLKGKTLRALRRSCGLFLRRRRLLRHVGERGIWGKRRRVQVWWGNTHTGLWNNHSTSSFLFDANGFSEKMVIRQLCPR